MPNYTETLKLLKPTEDEFYNVAVPNTNMDALDTYIKELQKQNALLHAELANKADIESLRLSELTLADGFEYDSSYDSYYYKNQFNEAYVVFAIVKTQGALVEGELIFTLPEGYSPRLLIAGRGLAFPVNLRPTVSSSGIRHTTAQVNLHPYTGEVRVSITDTTSSYDHVRGFLFYPCAI